MDIILTSLCSCRGLVLKWYGPVFRMGNQESVTAFLVHRLLFAASFFFSFVRVRSCAERECGRGAGAKQMDSIFVSPRGHPLVLEFFKSPAVNTFVCDLDELRAKWRVYGQTTGFFVTLIFRSSEAASENFLSSRKSAISQAPSIQLTKTDQL